MMKKVQIKLTLILVGSLLMSSILTAQNLSYAKRSEIAKKSINALKDGTLILRLKSKNNKILAISEALEEKDLKEKERSRLEADLQSTIKGRDDYNRSLIDAFEAHYSFSKIYYMYDTASTALNDGQRRGIFLNTSMESDPTITIADSSFFVVKTGTTDSASTTGVEALVVMDEQLKDLKKPFPYYVRVNSIGRLFTRIFNHKNLVKKDATAVVQKLEANFQRYWSAQPRT